MTATGDTGELSGPGPGSRDPAALLDETLDLAVQRTVGDRSASARPGQRDLAHHIAGAMRSAGHHFAEGPTGSGKSYACLVPAMLAAAEGKRTVISTETLALQSQIELKDAPIVAEAVAQTTGYRPSVAVLRGWSNYICSLATAATLGELLDEQAAGGGKPHPVMVSDDGEGLVALADALGARRRRSARAKLAIWAAAQVADEASGERGAYAGEASAEDWAAVSTPSADCPGTARCRFGSSCRPAASRAEAAGADIVVTNHSMLAVQAATAAPVVLDSPNLGDFDAIVVDEAHALADKVRQAAATVLSGSWVIGAVRSFERAAEGRRGAKTAADDGARLAKGLDERLVAAIAAGSKGSSRGRPGDPGPVVVPVPVEADPLDGFGETIVAWAARAKRLLPDAKSATDHAGAMAIFRATSRLTGLVDAARASAEGRKGVARWLEGPDDRADTSRFSGATLRTAGVETSGLLRANVWQARSVTVMSATLPAAAGSDLGIDARRVVYPSPFDAAYASSLLYVPRADAGAGSLASQRYGGRPRFDTAAHASWAEPIVVSLVGANRGSALVLSATASAGRRYAEALRSALVGAAEVHSQWDGRSLRQAVAAWRDDPSSVLVGTRSLMTGVDAPGATCSLVIVDRVPRAAGNPIDDARVDALVERLEIDRWAADRLVYVADAALLLEQAAGRLIRSTTDRGMVAVLDPRLLRVGPYSYQAPTRAALLDALGRFPRRTADLDVALAYLAGGLESSQAAATG